MSEFQKIAETAGEIGTRFSPRPYLKAKVRVASPFGGVTRIVWAVRITDRLIQVVDKWGVWTGEFLLLDPADYVWVKEARLNLDYGDLEVLDHGE